MTGERGSRCSDLAVGAGGGVSKSISCASSMGFCPAFFSPCSALIFALSDCAHGLQYGSARIFSLLVVPCILHLHAV